MKLVINTAKRYLCLFLHKMCYKSWSENSVRFVKSYRWAKLLWEFISDFISQSEIWQVCSQTCLSKNVAPDHCHMLCLKTTQTLWRTHSPQMPWALAASRDNGMEHFKIVIKTAGTFCTQLPDFSLCIMGLSLIWLNMTDKEIRVHRQVIRMKISQLTAKNVVWCRKDNSLRQCICSALENHWFYGWKSDQSVK